MEDAAVEYFDYTANYRKRNQYLFPPITVPFFPQRIDKLTLKCYSNGNMRKRDEVEE